jgi:hypothetical protein
VLLWLPLGVAFVRFYNNINNPLSKFDIAQVVLARYSSISRARCRETLWYKNPLFMTHTTQITDSSVTPP